MRLLITGKNGFIGRRLQQLVKAQGHTFVRTDHDVREMPKQRLPVDAVIHLAAVTDKSLFLKDPAEAYRTNVCGTLNVLEFCRRNRAKLVFLSTCGVYTEKTGKVRETDALGPRNPYTFSKLIGEQLCLRYQHDHGLPVVILRLFNVYGHGQDPGFLIPYIFECVLRHKKMIIRTPSSLRDFIYIDDVCTAILRSLEYGGDALSIFNVGSSRTYTVDHVVRAVIRLSGGPLPPRPVRKAGEAQPAICADLTRSKRLLEWKPTVSIEDGLSRMWKSYAK